MESNSQNARLVKRAYWLAKIRWLATVGVVVCTYLSSNVLAISLQDFALYGIAVLLALYNTTVLLLLNRFTKERDEPHYSAVRKIISFQMCADLLILTVLLHYAGGIENPFILYFIFHVVIASVLLSVRQSYLQATFTVLVFGFLVLLEYYHLIPHHCLQGFVPRCLHQDGLYILGTFFVFVTTLYLVVYMTSSIATRLKQAEQAYKQANVLLQEKDHIKDEYVFRVTHDIKEHLAAIQSCLSVVANRKFGNLNATQTDFVQRAIRRTTKLKAFIKALLNLTKIKLDGKFEKTCFSLRDVVSNALSAVEAKAKAKSIKLNSNIEASEDKIYGNPFSIEEAITNLLHNAIKYTPINGAIGVTAIDDGEFARLEVSDTGIGIPEEDQDKVFDEFFRAGNAKKAEKDGTGLGLSIVKQIVERHGGKRWVDSKEGEGITFRCTLRRVNSLPS